MRRVPQASHTKVKVSSAVVFLSFVVCGDVEHMKKKKKCVSVKTTELKKKSQSDETGFKHVRATDN